MRIACLALVAPLLLVHPAAAQESLLTKPPDCGYGTQMEMNACTGGAFKAADAALNAAYRKVAARLAGKPAARGLVEAQRAWIRFRDAECAFATNGYEGGSILPMLVAECMEQMTRQRTAVLQDYLSCNRDGCIVPAAP